MGNLFEVINPLTANVPISRNQSIYLKGKSIDWFLYGGNMSRIEARAYFSHVLRVVSTRSAFFEK